MECSIPPAGSLRFGQTIIGYQKLLAHSPNEDKQKYLGGIVGIINLGVHCLCTSGITQMWARRTLGEILQNHKTDHEPITHFAVSAGL
jgi:hypothetical protein